MGRRCVGISDDRQKQDLRLPRLKLDSPEQRVFRSEIALVFG